jgi:hypothetical protein
MFHAVSPYYVACREIGFSRRRDIERLAQSMHVVPPAALSSTFAAPQFTLWCGSSFTLTWVNPFADLRSRLSKT